MARTNRTHSPLRPILLAALVLLPAAGCVSPPIGDLPRHAESEVVEVLDGDYLPFRVSPTNRYAIVMNGRVFTPPAGPVQVSSPEDLRRGVPEEDRWIAGDMEQLTRLLLNKGYDVYRLDFGVVTPKALHGLLQRMTYVADDDTRMFVAYSGEGDATGWRTRTLRIGASQHLAPPGVTVAPEELFAALAPVRGHKALLVNACESGIFAQGAARWSEFSGVVIAACPEGFATTPHEPAGTTAIFAAFLELYEDDPAVERNLASVEIERAGGLWTNLAHHWSQLWAGGGLPLSYEPAIYVSGDYWF